ncbi:MAG: recombinase [Flavobacteriales bacterium]|nr:recombinase [Flavobacteriales bacterium]
MPVTEVRRVLEEIAQYDGEDVDLLARLVRAIRPTKVERKQGQVPGFTRLLALLENDQDLRAALAAYLHRCISGKRLNRALVDPGMVSGDFWHELRERLNYKLLPFQPDPGTIDHVLVNVFFMESDGDWVRALDQDDCVRLLTLLGGGSLYDLPAGSFTMDELLFAVRVIALRIAGRAFDSRVLRMVPERENLENPFVALDDELDGYVAGLRDGSVGRGTDDLAYRQIGVLMTQCHGMIEQAYRNSAVHGIGFRVNQNLMILQRMLERLELILDSIVIDPARDGRSATVDLVKNLVAFNTGRTQIKSFIDRSTQIVAREISGHAGRTGEHYITSTAPEYMRMLWSALGGGAIVACAVILKTWYGTFDVSLFTRAFLYSMNYAMAFIAIYLTHCTLATKQPAMTAATIAATLENGHGIAGDQRYQGLSRLMARVWRSQFIAFVGNVFMSFPVAVLLAYGWGYLFGGDMLAHKYPKMIHELDPFTSPAIPHAAIAGVFLFISGLIAGNVGNKIIHGRIPYRIEHHPALKLTMSARWRQRLAAYYERNAAGIISNFWFGCFLGSIGIVGVFFGLPLDIRHITFAAGNMGLGMVGGNWYFDTWTIVVSILGIGVIGFFNFIVSFGLSLGLALRSRGIPFKELLPIAGAVFAYFKQRPMAFFFPLREKGEEVAEV